MFGRQHRPRPEQHPVVLDRRQTAHAEDDFFPVVVRLVAQNAFRDVVGDDHDLLLKVVGKPFCELGKDHVDGGSVAQRLQPYLAVVGIRAPALRIEIIVGQHIVVRRDHLDVGTRPGHQGRRVGRRQEADRDIRPGMAEIIAQQGDDGALLQVPLDHVPQRVRQRPRRQHGERPRAGQRMARKDIDQFHPSIERIEWPAVLAPRNGSS